MILKQFRRLQNLYNEALGKAGNTCEVKNLTSWITTRFSQAALSDIKLERPQTSH